MGLADPTGLAGPGGLVVWALPEGLVGEGLATGVLPAAEALSASTSCEKNQNEMNNYTPESWLSVMTFDWFKSCNAHLLSQL